MIKTVTALLAITILSPINPANALEPADIYRNNASAVVLIYAKMNSRNLTKVGSGFIIREDGLILTNAHVVIGKDRMPLKEITVFLKPEKVTGNFQQDLANRQSAQVVKYNSNLDIALLLINNPPKNLNALGFADSEKVDVGQKAVAIGHPEQGGLWTLTTGTISSRINNIGKVNGKNMFQTEASINHGNSGGPLMDDKGLVVGMNSSTVRKSKSGATIVGINFAIQSNVILKWLNRNDFAFRAKHPSTEQPKSLKVEATSPTPKKAEKIPASENSTKPVTTALAENGLVANGRILTPKKPFKWHDIHSDKFIVGDMEDLIRKEVKEKFH